MEHGKFNRDRNRDDKGRDDRNREDRGGERGGDRGGYDRPRFDRSGGDRGGYDRPRYDRGGGDRGGYDRPRYDRGGGDRGGYDRPRFDRGGGGGGYDRPRFDRGGGGGGFDRDNEESVFSKKVRAGKRRTYFFDVRKTRGEDYFITITESTRREDGYGYKRHKIFLYKEDFNRFVASLNEVVDYVKTDLMPEFDYEEFDRRQAEWEAQNRDGEDFDEEHDEIEAGPEDETAKTDIGFEEEREDDFSEDKRTKDKKGDDDDMGW